MSPARSRRRIEGAAILLAAVLVPMAACGPPTSGQSAVELYTEHCARCHGEAGHGDPRALALTPGADLGRSAIVRSRARGRIFLRISQGYGSMPAFSHKLERGDIDLLVDYVLELPSH